MPPNTGVPTSRRASCEAPVAITSGSRPRMKAKRRHHHRAEAQARAFGRRLAAAARPARAAPWRTRRSGCRSSPPGRSARPCRSAHRDRASDPPSTMAAKEPEDADRHRQQHRHRDRPALVERRPGTGYANSTAKPRMIAVLPSARFSWKAVSVHSPAIAVRQRAAPRPASIAASAWPDETPGAGLPWTVTARRLL